MPLPTTVQIMQPTLVSRPFHHDGWVYEEKVDRRAPRLSSNQEVSIGLGARARVHCSNSVGDTLPRELWGRTAL